MTITLDLTPEEEARLEAQARAQGVELTTVLRGLIAQLPPQQTKRTLSGYGKFAHLKRTVDDFHRDRQEDRDRENRR